METLFNICKRHENDLNNLLLEIPNLTEPAKHSLRLMQVRHQTEELQEVRSMLKARKKII